MFKKYLDIRILRKAIEYVTIIVLIATMIYKLAWPAYCIAYDLYQWRVESNLQEMREEVNNGKSN